MPWKYQLASSPPAPGPWLTPSLPGDAILQVIDLGDDMELEVLPANADKDILQCSDPTIPCDERNLVIKVRY